MRSSIEKASGIKMLMPCYKDLVMLAVNGVRSGRQMVSVAVQTDVSPAECNEFVVEQTEIPEDKQGGPELSSASTEHFPANQLTPGATPFD